MGKQFFRGKESQGGMGGGGGGGGVWIAMRSSSIFSVSIIPVVHQEKVLVF